MYSPVQLLPGAISELFASVADTKVLTLADRYGLMAALMDEALDEEEQRAIDRILRSVAKGRVRIAGV